MANRAYLTYQNTQKEFRQFEYASIIPSLWIELTNVDLIESQEDGLVKAYNTTNFEENNDEDVSLKIPRNVAIQNLTNKINQNLKENEDIKKLRIDFLKFIQTQVIEDSIIELSLLEIMFLDEEPVIFQELKKFHADKQIYSQKEKITYQAIGFNDDFELFSTVYQNLKLKAQAVKDKIKQKAEKKEKITKRFDIVLMVLIGLALAFLGIFGIIIKNEIKLGITLLSLSLICWLYIYFKHWIK